MNPISLPDRAPQPEPIRTHSVTHPNRGRPVTAILRTWASPADSGRCRLCPPGTCSVDEHGQCLIVVDRAIPEADAPLYAAPAASDRLRVISPT